MSRLKRNGPVFFNAFPVLKILFFFNGIFNTPPILFGIYTGMLITTLCALAAGLFFIELPIATSHLTRSPLLYWVVEIASDIVLGIAFMSTLPIYLYSYFWHYRHKTMKKVSIFPSSLTSAKIQSRLVGVKNINNINTPDTFSDIFTPVFELHIKHCYNKPGKLTSNDLTQMADEFKSSFRGCIVYAITTINIERLITDAGTEYNRLLVINKSQKGITV